MLRVRVRVRARCNRSVSVVIEDMPEPRQER